MIKPLPDEDGVYSMLINEESQSGVQASMPSLNSDSIAFYVGVEKPYSQRVTFDSQIAGFDSSKKSNIICRYCKKHGHQIDKCYKLYSYPLGFQTKF